MHRQASDRRKRLITGATEVSEITCSILGQLLYNLIEVQNKVAMNFICMFQGWDLLMYLVPRQQ